MKKTLHLIVLFVCLATAAISQNKKATTTDTAVKEYITVEGPSQTGVPKQLQGTWILIAGVNKITPHFGAQSNETNSTVEISRDSATSTITIDGESTTTTEIHIDKMVAPKNELTPAQKSKMHVAEKPSINFYGSNATVSGFTGCNKFTGRYSISENKITFLDAAASTKMACTGEYDEQSFLSKLNKVNAFSVNDGILDLLNGKNVLLSFLRK